MTTAPSSVSRSASSSYGGLTAEEARDFMNSLADGGQMGYGAAFTREHEND